MPANDFSEAAAKNRAASCKLFCDRQGQLYVALKQIFMTKFLMPQSLRSRHCLSLVFFGEPLPTAVWTHFAGCPYFTIVLCCSSVFMVDILSKKLLAKRENLKGADKADWRDSRVEWWGSLAGQINWPADEGCVSPQDFRTFTLRLL